METGRPGAVTTSTFLMERVMIEFAHHRVTPEELRRHDGEKNRGPRTNECGHTGPWERISPVLTPEQMRRVGLFGTREDVAEGTVLFNEGDRSIDFFVVVSGGVEISQYVDGGMKQIVYTGPGQFIGDPSTLTGHAAVVQAHAAVESEVLRIKPDRFRRIVVEDSELSDLFLRTFLDRTLGLDRRGLWLDQSHRLPLRPRYAPHS